MKYPIRIFSDLHLAHPSCRIESVSDLRPLISGAGTVIFNGDTYEQRNPGLREKGESMFRELKQLCADCGAEAIFLNGNHDAEISDLESLDVVDDRIFLTHGDVLFPLISAWNPKIWKLEPEMRAIRFGIGEKRMREDLDAALLATSKCRLLTSGDEREFRSKRFRNLRAMAKLVWPPRRPVEILKCWWETPGKAAAFMKQHRPEAQIFAFGHTHRAFVKESENGPWLVNTGGFLSVGKAFFLEVDKTDCEVFEVQRENDCFKKGELVKKIRFS